MLIKPGFSSSIYFQLLALIKYGYNKFLCDFCLECQLLRNYKPSLNFRSFALHATNYSHKQKYIELKFSLMVIIFSPVPFLF